MRPPPARPQGPRIVIALPCHNEGPYLAPVLQAARPHGICVVVDDGSTDDTQAVAESLGAEVFAHGFNRGYGAAVASCLQVGRERGADVLVMLDGDGQHDPAEIPGIIAPILAGEADLVVGSRFAGIESEAPPYRRFGIGVITWLYNLGGAQRLKDAQCGFRAFGPRALAAIRPSDPGMGASVEMLIAARRAGLRMAEVPISCRYHPGGSSIHPVRHGVGVAWKVIVHRARLGDVGGGR